MSQLLAPARRGRLLIGLVVAILIAGLAAGSVGAAPATMRVTEGGGATFPARSLVLSLPKRSSLSPSQVHVTEDSRPVTGAVVTPLASAGAHDFGVVLAIDVSPSMRGARWRRRARSPRSGLGCKSSRS